MAKRDPDSYSAKQTKERATAALRWALNTPYKPQSDLVGNTGRKKKIARKKSKK